MPATKPFFSHYLPGLVHSSSGRAEAAQANTRSLAKSSFIIIINDTKSETNLGSMSVPDLNKALPKPPSPLRIGFDRTWPWLGRSRPTQRPYTRGENSQDVLRPTPSKPGSAGLDV